MYLSIDPGRNLGWALWGARGLIACGLGDPRSHAKHVVVSDAEVDVIHDVWIEDQIIYPRSPVPPNDVLTLAKTAHRLAGRYDVLGVTVHFVLPSEWKGQTPCTCTRTSTPAACTHHSRVWADLLDDEKNIVDKALTGVAPSKRHDVLDALGIGTWVRKTGKSFLHRVH